MMLLFCVIALGLVLALSISVFLIKIPKEEIENDWKEYLRKVHT